MIRPTLVLVLALTSPATLVAEEPSEEVKVQALKLGYVLNGNSMVRWGAIDVSTLINPLAPYPKPELEPFVAPVPAPLPWGKSPWR